MVSKLIVFSNTPAPHWHFSGNPYFVPAMSQSNKWELKISLSAAVEYTATVDRVVECSGVNEHFQKVDWFF